MSDDFQLLLRNVSKLESRCFGILRSSSKWGQGVLVSELRSKDISFRGDEEKQKVKFKEETIDY